MQELQSRQWEEKQVNASTTGRTTWTSRDKVGVARVSCARPKIDNHKVLIT